MDRRQDGVAAAEFADHSAPSQGKSQAPRAGYAEDGTTMRLERAIGPPIIRHRLLPAWPGQRSRGLARSHRRAPRSPLQPCRHAA